MNDLNDYVAIYKEQLKKGDIQKAYIGLIKYVMSLKVYLSNNLSGAYSFGNVSMGYMDFTYFPYFNDFSRNRKLRFGIVLNHKEVRIELWMMGQNASIQKKYWDLLKTTEWNNNRTTMPRYSIVELIVADNIDFNTLDSLSQHILDKTTNLSNSILEYIKNNES